jgi:hypothetical protein
MRHWRSHRAPSLTTRTTSTLGGWVSPARGAVPGERVSTCAMESDAGKRTSDAQHSTARGRPCRRSRRIDATAATRSRRPSQVHEGMDRNPEEVVKTTLLVETVVRPLVSASSWPRTSWPSTSLPTSGSTSWRSTSSPLQTTSALQACVSPPLEVGHDAMRFRRRRSRSLIPPHTP